MKINRTSFFTASVVLLLSSQEVFSQTSIVTKKWEKYSIVSSKVDFFYPKNILKLDSMNGQYSFEHSVPFEHPNPCILEGSEVSTLSKIIDLYFTLEVYKTGLWFVMNSKSSQYFMDNYVSGETLKLKEGFIDTIQIGKLKGYLISSGNEGCGVYQFVFPVRYDLTILLTKPYWPELEPGVIGEELYKKYSSLNGVILPSQAENLFHKVVESIEIK